MKETTIPAGETKDVFVKASPKGTPTGSTIAKCYPSFFNVQSG
jgi:hypothetical protein